MSSQIPPVPQFESDPQPSITHLVQQAAYGLNAHSPLAGSALGIESVGTFLAAFGPEPFGDFSDE